ncbi:hypothetical protein FQN51_005310 [Onygenales sp. PD_10]|nr:hypothetical protein FQN51_005310 [Onygenales sp. PD_10]
MAELKEKVPPYEDAHTKQVDTKDLQYNEAAGIYGDAETAERYGYVTRGWYQSAITLCVEIAAASLVIQFWDGAKDINVAAWISLVIVLVLFLNIFAVSIYGEAEFIFASIKIITIVGLLIMSLIIDLGGGPDGDRRGFRYWKSPGAMKEYVSTGDTGRFLGFFSTLVNACFSFGGVEMVASAAGEAANPRRNIPKAVRRVFYRILFFYVLGSLAIGMLVPYDDPNLLSAQETDGNNGAASPWVIAVRRAGIPVLPSIINAVILTSATSSANAFLYTGSRYLYALAQNKQAPSFLLKCSKTTGSNNVFIWFQNLTTIASLFTWCSICIACIKFNQALKAQGVDRSSMVFAAPFQPLPAYFALVFFSIIIVFNGFYAFTPWSVTNFLTAYIGIPIYFLLYGFWKIFKKTKPVKPAEADIWSGKAALDAVEWPEDNPRNIIEKVWYWIA